MVIGTAVLPGRHRRAVRRKRTDQATEAARAEARQSQAQLARTRAAVRDLSGLENSAIARELARNLQGR